MALQASPMTLGSRTEVAGIDAGGGELEEMASRPSLEPGRRIHIRMNLDAEHMRMPGDGKARSRRSA